MEPTKDRLNLIRSTLLQALSPSVLTIRDESYAHQNHVGAKNGGGHFAVNIVSNRFEDKSMVERHQMVYEALGDLMNTEIHAVSISAQAPSES